MTHNGRIVEAPAIRPELTYGLVRHWTRHSMVCVWCEHPMTDHVRLWRDGYRWRTCGGHDHSTPCECVNPVAEAERQ